MHTVLVVEDEAIIREDICTHLQDCGFAVMEAETADAATVLLLVHPGIDLVFTDVQMPGSMSGLDLAQWVLQNKPAIPVMIASGDAGRTAAMNELRGAETFTKPYNHDRVVERIRHVIAAGRAE